MEITPREIISSIAIIAIMFILGFFIGDKVNEYEINKQQEYITAVQIQEDKSLFEYGMKTNVGNAFVYGDFKAVDPVTHEAIPGKYFYIERIKEEYCRHTRTVTKTRTVNGKTQTYQETEVYYTWDEKGSEDWHCETIAFLGVEFPYGTIHIPASQHIDTQKVSSDVRYKYYAVPAETVGTLYANLGDNTISNTKFYQNKPIEKVYKSLTSSFRVVLFWIAWALFTGLVIFGFVQFENYWLED